MKESIAPAVRSGPLAKPEQVSRRIDLDKLRIRQGGCKSFGVFEAHCTVVSGSQNQHALLDVCADIGVRCIACCGAEGPAPTAVRPYPGRDATKTE